MIRRETERQANQPAEPEPKEQEGFDEDGEPIPTGEFEYKLWCNRRKADGLPVLPKPGAPVEKRKVASTIVPSGKIEDL